MYAFANAIVCLPLVHSSPFPLKNGLIQGSILSTILFNLFINDLSTELKQLPAIQLRPPFPLPLQINHLLFADDLALVAKSYSTMQKLISCCDKYSKEWLFKFGKEKTKVLTNDSQKLPIQINRFTIDYANSYVYLGIPFQITGIDTTKMIDQRTQTFIFQCRKIRFYAKTYDLSPTHIMYLYKTIARSQLEYGLGVIPLTKIEITQYETMQVTWIKNILGMQKNTKKESVLLISGMETIQTRQTYLAWTTQQMWQIGNIKNPVTRLIRTTPPTKAQNIWNNKDNIIKQCQNFPQLKQPNNEQLANKTAKHKWKKQIKKFILTQEKINLHKKLLPTHDEQWQGEILYHKLQNNTKTLKTLEPHIPQDWVVDTTLTTNQIKTIIMQIWTQCNSDMPTHPTHQKVCEYCQKIQPTNTPTQTIQHMVLECAKHEKERHNILNCMPESNKHKVDEHQYSCIPAIKQWNTLSLTQKFNTESTHKARLIAALTGNTQCEAPYIQHDIIYPVSEPQIKTEMDEQIIGIGISLILLTLQPHTIKQTHTQYIPYSKTSHNLQIAKEDITNHKGIVRIKCQNTKKITYANITKLNFDTEILLQNIDIHTANINIGSTNTRSTHQKEIARMKHRALLSTLQPNDLTIYTDGSLIKAQNYTQAGIGITYKIHKD